MVERFSLSQTLLKKPNIHGLPFEQIKTSVLGKEYELGLVFIGSKLSRRLNRDYRSKDYPTNILSFPLSASEGEILINPYKAKSEARARNMSEREYLLFLFIHGTLHLKGLAHSDAMDKEEERLLKKFRSFL